MPDAVEQRAEHLLEVPLEPTHLPGGGRVMQQKALGQAGHTERQAPQPERAAVVDEHELDAAAAHVDQQVRPPFEPERMTGGAEDEPRLLEPRDDPHGDPGLTAQPAHQRRPVPRLAHRARRHGPQAVDPPRAREPSEVLHGTHRRIHRLGREPASGEGAPSEAHHLLHPLHHPHVPFRPHLGDHHVDRVGPDVDGGQAHGGILAICPFRVTWGPPTYAASFHVPVT